MMKLMIKDTDLFTVNNLIGLKIKNIKINTILDLDTKKKTKEIIFELEDKKITMFHREDSTETVFIYNHTNLDSLIGKTIVEATEKVSGESFDKHVENGCFYDDMFLWTFFKFTFSENNCSETSETSETSENETADITCNCNETSETSETSENETAEITWFGTSDGNYDVGVEFEPEDEALKKYIDAKPCIFDNLKGLKIRNVIINTILDLNTKQEKKEIIFESNYETGDKQITMFPKNFSKKVHLHYTNLNSLINKKIIEIKEMSSNKTFDETRENQPDVDDDVLWKFYKLICSKDSDNNCSENETVEIIWFSTSNDMDIEFKIENAYRK